MKRNNMKIMSKKLSSEKSLKTITKKKKCFFNEKYNFFSAKKFPKVTEQKKMH